MELKKKINNNENFDEHKYTKMFTYKKINNKIKNKRNGKRN